MLTKQNKWYNYILLLTILFSMFFLQDYKIIGLSAFLILPLGFIMFLLSAKISQVKISREWIKSRLKKDYVILGILFWVVLRLFASFFSAYLGATINLNFILMTILSCFLYIIFYGSKGYGENWLEAITISGGVGTIIILLSILNIPYINGFLMLEEWYWESLASYILLPIYSSVVLYCTSEKKSKQILSFIVILLSFFALFLINNQTSLWMVFFFLLGIPMLFRPRANLVKKSMQLIFAYLFLWCNMSLIINYVKLVTWPPVTYTLEAGVYGELVLSIGVLFFFHFWDHIPEGKDLNYISMIGLQRFLQKCFLGFLLFLIGCILNIHNIASWKLDGFNRFIIALIQPLVEELQNKQTSFFTLYQNTGIVITVLVLTLLLMMGKKIYGKVHKDKIWTNYLFLFYLLFMAQFLLLNIADQVVLVNIMLLLWGLTIEEPPLNVKSIKMDIVKKETTNIIAESQNIEVKEEKISIKKEQKPEVTIETTIKKRIWERKEEKTHKNTETVKEKKALFKKKIKEESILQIETKNKDKTEQQQKQSISKNVTLEQELQEALKQHERPQSESARKFEELMRREKRGGGQ